MLSRNNRNEQFRKQEPKKQRFAIKKLTVGVASVLIGFTFMGMNVSADTTAEANDETTNQQIDTTQTNTDTTNTLNVKSSDQSNDKAAESSNDNTAAQNLQQSLAAVQKAQTANATEGQSEDASDYNSFLNALRNGNTSTINLTNDIDFSNANLNSGRGTYEQVTNSGIARAVTINGNGHELKMGSRYIDLTNATKNNSNWNITFKDLTLQTTSGYGAIWFENKGNDELTFNNVGTTDDSGQLVDSSNVNVTFKGNNNIKGNLTNSNVNGEALVQAHNVNFINGSTVF